MTPPEKKKVSSIKCSEATHGWAVMYGSLFIFFYFVYPSNPSCYIGRRQQMSRDNSHRAPVEITRRRGGGWGESYQKVWKAVRAFSVAQPRRWSHGGGGGRAGQNVAATNGAGRQSEHKHTCLLISLMAKRITQVRTVRDSASTSEGYINIFGRM